MRAETAVLFNEIYLSVGFDHANPSIQKALHLCRAP